MNKKLIFPINIYNDKIEFVHIGNKYGHNNIVLKNLDNDKTNIYSNITSSDNHNWFLNTVILSKIDDGSFSIYTQNADGSDLSEESNITVLGKTNKETITKLLDVIGEDVNDEPYKYIIENIVSNNRVLFKTLFEACINNNFDDNIKNGSAKALKYYIDKINKFISQNTNTENFVNIYTDNISYNENVTKILDVNISKDEYTVTPYTVDQTKNNIYIPQENNSLHMYIFIDDDGDFSDVRFMFKPNDDVLKILWTKDRNNRKAYELAIEKTINYPYEYFTFSEEEKKILSIFEELTPVQPIFKNTKILYSKGKIEADLSYDFGLMKALGKDFYLSFRELELGLDSSTRRRVSINKNKIIFYAEDIGITNEPYIVCITDNENNVLSPPYLIDLLNIYDTNFTNYENKDEDSAYIEIDENEFNEKYRQYLLFKYEKHLKTYINRYYSNNVFSIVDELYNTIYNDNDTNSVDAPIEIIDGACTSRNINSFFDICKSLYEDNTVYGKYMVNYFSDNINYYYKENSIRIPPTENTIFIFDSYYINGYMKREYRDCDTQNNTKYRFDNKCSFGVFWALNKNTYTRSGFVIIDFTQPITRPKFSSYLMDTLQAVN